MSDELDELFNVGNDDTVEKILAQLLTKEDIELKTNIPNPMAITKLSMIADYLEGNQMPITCAVIRSFVQHYLELAPSKNGERAKQIVKAFSDISRAGFEQERPDMLGRPKE